MKPLSNFNIQKERADQSPDDYQFSSITSQPSLVSIPLAEREQWLPRGQNQFDQYQDFQDCSTRGSLNALEALLTYGYTKQIFSLENRAWLVANGYLQGNKITLSNRFNSTLDGTTHQGNSLKAPLQSIHADGVIPQSLLPEDNLTWDQYYNRADITQKLIDLGHEFASRFTINYEAVNVMHFATVAKDDLLSVACYAWPDIQNGIYPAVDYQPNHCVCVYKPQYFIFDNYEDGSNTYMKQLANDYKFFDTGYRIFISSEQMPLKKNQIQFWQSLAAALIALRDYLLQHPIARGLKELW